jgi:hypothetical protein
VTHVVLLGPQRFRPTVPEVAQTLGVGGPIATVTAGWQEREPDDAELDDLLAGRSANLGLYGRWLDVVDRDPEFAAADRRHRDRLEDLQDVYLLRLHHAMQAVYELERRVADPAIAGAELADAVAAVRALDARHRARLTEVHADFHADWPPHERPVSIELCSRIDHLDGVLTHQILAVHRPEEPECQLLLPQTDILPVH